MTNKTTDGLVVGFDCSNGKDNTVLIVGRREENGSVKIINAFRGETAEEIYEKLTTARGKYDQTKTRIIL